MKPNFALSLSFEGIRLSHRAAGGWREVGEVSLSATDMAAELAVLRKTASALEPSGVRCKLIIPNEQIKYLSLATPAQSDASRRVEVKMALKQATPYDLDDLVHDISLEGDTTHVAAVARDTLAEAEAFANEHRFHPVSFVAVPGDNGFLGEPYFGMTTKAADLLESGETVEPDGIAVVVLGPLKESPIADPTPDTDTEKPQVAPDVEPDGALDGAPDETPAEAKADANEKVEVAKVEEDGEDTVEPLPALDDDGNDGAVVAVTDRPDPPSAGVGEDAVEDETQETTTDVAPPEIAAVPPANETPTEEIAAPVAAVAATKPVKLTIDTPGGFVSRRSAAGPIPDSSQPSTAGVNAGTVKAPGPVRPDSTSLDQPAPPPVAAPAKAGFLSRRKTAKPIVATPAAAPVAPRAVVAGPAAIAKPKGEAERMTVFGARPDQTGGKPRFLGVILTVVLLVFLAGVAAWATVFLDDGIAGIFRGDKSRATASAPEFQIEPRVIRTPMEDVEGIETASLDMSLSPEDSAVLDALRDPEPAPVVEQISPQEAAARYAVTGIWPYAPDLPAFDIPQMVGFNDVYLTGIDPVSGAKDAIALPTPKDYATDIALAAMASPPAPGTNFALDARGLIIPQVEGALSPEGFTVYLGKPPLTPPADPARRQDTPAADDNQITLAGLRPRERPAGLAESTERAQLDGLTRNELARLRPQLRPKSVQQAAEIAAQKPEEEAEDPANPTASATKLAAVQSPRPDSRPRNFNNIVRRAQRATRQEAETVRTASAGTIAPRSVTPKVPSKASVARSATIRNAINLKRVNLIGVYGKPSSRRALVRLSNGRYKKVTVGDRIDGGRVSAISNSELSYRKGSRSVVLKMPKS